MSNLTFSPYQITWVEFRATKGIVTLKDKRLFSNGRYIDRTQSTTYKVWFSCKESAERYVSRIKTNRLSKAYEVRYFNDKQFALAKESEGYAIHFTKRQNEQMFVIGRNM